jgi:activator of HSP90 ATPase
MPILCFLSLVASSDFTQGMILPKKDTEVKNGEQTKVIKDSGVKLPSSVSTPDMKQLQIGVKVEMKLYTCKQNFKCPPVELYNVLTQPELMRAFTCASVQVHPSVGGTFNLFEGNITGTFIELVNYSTLKCLFALFVQVITCLFHRPPIKKLSRNGDLKPGRKVIIRQ